MHTTEVWTRLGVSLAIAMLLLLPGMAAAQSATDLAQPPGAEWATVGGQWGNGRYSTLAQISTTNVATLKGAWMVRLGSGLGSKYSQQATPVVQNGVMYVPTGQQDVFALNVRTGEVAWKYTSEDVDPRSDGTWANRGVALGDGLVFSGRVDGSLIAIDQKTGQRVWKAQVGDKPPYVEPLAPGWRPQTQFINSAPVYFDGIVYTGLSGGDRGLRGRITALDSKTGKELWRFYTIPGPNDYGGDSWPAGSNAYESGGAAVWVTPAVDPDLGLLYFNTGNPWPDFDGSSRLGDNLFTSSIVAIDAKTGQYRWHFQLTHHDLWDYDSPSPVVLFQQTYNGQLRKGIAGISSAGWMFLLDRATGEPLIPVEERPVPQEPRQHSALTQPFPVDSDPVVPQCITDPAPGYLPGCFYDPSWDIPNRVTPTSGPRQAPFSYSQQTGYFYVAASIGQTAVKRVDDFNGGLTTPIGSQRSGMLTAIDSRTNRIAWQKPMPYPLSNGAGTMTTAGGLLFLPSPDGNVIAMDARTGDELWRFQTGFGADAPAITYLVDGQQYVAVAAGGGRGSPANGDSVWAFKLGGSLNQLYPPPVAPSLVGFSGAPVKTDAVSIDGFAFGPQRATVAVGGSITWTNKDGEPHTATDQKGAWDTGLINQGQSVTVTFDQPGPYNYACAPHPWMVGQIVVQ